MTMRHGLAATALLSLAALTQPAAAQTVAQMAAETAAAQPATSPKPTAPLPPLSPPASRPSAVPPATTAVPSPTPPTPASAPSVPSGGILDGYSRIMFSFNQTLYAKLDQASAWWSGKPAGAAPAAAPAPGGGSLGNVVANLVNEPVTAVTALAVGEASNSWRSVQRFAINSTAGVLGYYDTATAWGYGPTVSDAGLSLCKAGVGEGPYLVLPFIGPRTVRDAVSDVVLTNAVLWVAAGSLLGTGASLQTIVIAEGVEIVADIVATRQIDPQAKAIGFTDYDVTRDRYLAQRRARCDALRGAAAAG